MAIIPLAFYPKTDSSKACAGELARVDTPPSSRVTTQDEKEAKSSPLRQLFFGKQLSKQFRVLDDPCNLLTKKLDERISDLLIRPFTFLIGRKRATFARTERLTQESRLHNIGRLALGTLLLFSCYLSPFTGLACTALLTAGLVLSILSPSKQTHLRAYAYMQRLAKAQDDQLARIWEEAGRTLRDPKLLFAIAMALNSDLQPQKGSPDPISDPELVIGSIDPCHLPHLWNYAGGAKKSERVFACFLEKVPHGDAAYLVWCDTDPAIKGSGKYLKKILKKVRPEQAESIWNSSDPSIIEANGALFKELARTPHIECLRMPYSCVQDYNVSVRDYCLSVLAHYVSSFFSTGKKSSSPWQPWTHFIQPRSKG